MKLSKKKLTAGESIRVEVQLSDAARDVANNGVYGPSQFLQYRDLQWSDCGSSVSSMLVNHCLFALAGIVALIPLAAEAQSGPIVENFYIACANAQNGTPFLPQGWTANPDPSVSDTQLVCSTNGIGITGSSFDTKLYYTMFNALSTGNYTLTASGAGAMVIVKNGFGDFSFKSRTRIVNLISNAPIVNQVDFSWDGATETDGLIEVWGSSLKWLRLEQRPENPQSLALAIPTSTTTTNGWNFYSGTTYSVTKGTNTVGVTLATSTARLAKTFQLPAGRYKVTMTTKGWVNVTFTSGPDATQRYTTLDEQQRSSLSTNAALSRVINASGQDVTVDLTASGPNQTFSFSNISITPVTDTPPTTAALSAARPSPWPARGATTASVYGLVSVAKDLNANTCLRSPDHTGDLAQLSLWGAKIARISAGTVTRASQSGCRLLNLTTDLNPDGSIKPDAFWSKAWPVILNEIYQVVQTAGRQGLKVVLLMEPPTPTMALGTTTEGWVNLQARKEFSRGMSELIKKLAPLRQNVWAYDLYNEPFEYRDGIGNLPASQWRNLAIEAIFAAREQETLLRIPDSQRSWFVFEPGLFPSSYWREEYAQLRPLPDTRVLYSEHFYDPFSFTHQNICQPNYPIGTEYYGGNVAGVTAALQPLNDFSMRTGAPFYMGEFGVAVWAGWSEVLGADGKSQTPQQWQPRLDANGQAINDNVNWLRDVMDAMKPFGFAWTQHSFRTYYAWDSEITPNQGPCGPFNYNQPNQPDTPAMGLMKAYLKGN